LDATTILISAFREPLSMTDPSSRTRRPLATIGITIVLLGVALLAASWAAPRIATEFSMVLGIAALVIGAGCIVFGVVSNAPVRDPRHYFRWGVIGAVLAILRPTLDVIGGRFAANPLYYWADFLVLVASAWSLAIYFMRRHKDAVATAN
jgi:hypothetical protein